MTDRINQAQLDHTIGQQSQRPICEPLRWLSQSHGNDLRLLFSIETFLPWWVLARLSVQCDFNSIGAQSLPQTLNGLHTTGKSFGNSGVRPAGATNIGLQQYLSASNFLRRTSESPTNFGQGVPFFLRKPDDILLLHVISSLNHTKSRSSAAYAKPLFQVMAKH